MTNGNTTRHESLVEVRGYQVALDRLYHADSHMWVKPVRPGEVRVGLDPLGVETSGTLAQLSFANVGDQVAPGRAFGQLEAAKFVGPLVSPVTGTVARINDAVLADPGLAERDPLGEGWLVDLSGTDEAELARLLGSPDEITDWFARTVDEYRLKGVIAE